MDACVREFNDRDSDPKSRQQPHHTCEGDRKETNTQLRWKERGSEREKREEGREGGRQSMGK